MRNTIHRSVLGAAGTITKGHFQLSPGLCFLFENNFGYALLIFSRYKTRVNTRLNIMLQTSFHNDNTLHIFQLK